MRICTNIAFEVFWTNVDSNLWRPSIKFNADERPVYKCVVPSPIMKECTVANLIPWDYFLLFWNLHNITSIKLINKHWTNLGQCCFTLCLIQQIKWDEVDLSKNVLSNFCPKQSNKWIVYPVASFNFWTFYCFPILT
jgi:hypothetical protein